MHTIKTLLTEIQRLEHRGRGPEIRIRYESDPPPEKHRQADELYRRWIVLDGRPDNERE